MVINMADNMKVQSLKTFGTLMTTAFAFIAGLAWNEAIRAIINEFLKSGSAVIGLLIYAVIVTIIAVVATLMIGRALGKAGIELDEE